MAIHVESKLLFFRRGLNRILILRKQLSKPNTTPKVTPKKIMALTVILMLAVVNPFNLFLVYR